MYKFLLLLLISIITLHADFFNSAEKAELKQQQERARLCKVFMKKATDYKKTMRYDDLARITLGSYRNRAKIFCAKEAPKKVQKIEDNVSLEPQYVQDISHEDTRLCKIFLSKVENYKKNMKEDELSFSTLASYQKRAEIFCSKKMLEKKEKDVREEDVRLCKIFQQGPLICKKLYKDTNDSLYKETLKSFKKREKIFCSSAPLKKKDLEVHKEHNRLCKIYSDKLIAYEDHMRNDELAYATLKSYKKRAIYFCALKEPVKETEK